MFRDRRDAGRQLAARLTQWWTADPVVVGLPRGGLPVAVQVARVLRAPLDVLVVHKVGAPGLPELALAAVAEGGVAVLNDGVIRDLGVSPSTVERLVAVGVTALANLVGRYRGGRPAVRLAGRTVIIIDDGMATGATARAAVRVAQARGAGQVVVAMPVASASAASDLVCEAAQVVCLDTIEELEAVGEWYEDFSPVSDEEVTEILAAADRRLLPERHQFAIPAGRVQLRGTLTVPGERVGLVVFAHGSAGSECSPGNLAIAEHLGDRGFAILQFNLLPPVETTAHGFDLPLLAGRLVEATRWMRDVADFPALPCGFFAANSGAAPALWAASELGARVRAVVSCGGRPDLAGPRLGAVVAPTLLIVGGREVESLDLNRRAEAKLGCIKELRVLPGANRLFEEPGALESVAELAAAWFVRYLLPTAHVAA
jgi:putative phosphoribosyl transferase